MEQEAEHNKKQLKPFRFTPFPFHHLAWNEDSIEQRLAWAKQAVDEGYDINAVYKPSMDPPYPKDTVSTPLMEILDYPMNYNQKTNRMDDIVLVKFLLDNGADPRVRAGNIHSPKHNAIELADIHSYGNGETSQKYYKEAWKLLEAKARELDGEMQRTTDLLLEYQLIRRIQNKKSEQTVFF
ncbi:hypothetical protein K4K51_002831 [Colletotrichum sp. SAR 10_75]|nr:hypothetical protein K4K51_002831 [Colletotrichum sp. SAR 10_75]